LKKKSERYKGNAGEKAVNSLRGVGGDQIKECINRENLNSAKKAGATAKLKEKGQKKLLQNAKSDYSSAEG